MIELCDLKVPPHDLDGQSLLPLLRKPGQVTKRVSVTMFGPGNGSLRTDRWRFIRYSDGSEELYDLSADPREWKNLAGKSEFRKLLVNLRAQMAPYIVDADQ